MKTYLILGFSAAALVGSSITLSTPAFAKPPVHTQWHEMATTRIVWLRTAPPKGYQPIEQYNKTKGQK